MRLLLDTHVWLWLLCEPDRLGPHFCALIDDEQTELHLSVASLWEVAIKTSIGKLRLSVALDELLAQGERDLGLNILPIHASHALAVESLPSHHRDPFDRMLVAQANAEMLTIATVDSALGAYPVRSVSPRE